MGFKCQVILMIATVIICIFQ